MSGRFVTLTQEASRQVWTHESFAGHDLVQFPLVYANTDANASTSASKRDPLPALVVTVEYISIIGRYSQGGRVKMGMKCRSLWALSLFALAPLSAMAQSITIYADALGNGWQNWSWATVNFNSTNPVRTGQFAISMEPDGFEGLYFASPGSVHSFADYSGLRLWVHGGAGSNQSLRLTFQLGQTVVFERPLNQIVSGGAIAAGQWREVFQPFSGAGAPVGTFDGVILQDLTGANQSAIHVDDVVLEAGGPPPGPVAVSIDLAGTRRAIDPLIYGVNFGSDAQHADLRYPTRRWGGNSTTRYNWQFDVHNTASDYFFQNIVDGDGQNLPNGSSANAFVSATRLQGGEAMLTIPTIGWVPKDLRQKQWGFSQQLYGAQTLDECRFYAPNPPPWCTADSGNGLCAGGPFCQGGKIVGNNPLDTSKPAPPSYAAEWVSHLRARHGSAGQGGVRFFALDNEAMLWDSTHRDVHPLPATYDEVWTRGRDRALAIKAVEPNAQIFGPVSWGWCDYWTSAADAALGNCFDGPDRVAHGNVPFVEWYLQRICAETGPGGVRLVDYLDLHYYPQGAGIAGLDNNVIAGEQPDVQARRLRSLRELYDPSWSSESWIGQTAYPNPNFLRRARAAIAAHCPGTRLALTEYKWGPDNGVTGALAQAELLAIFGREGVDYATRWVAPEVGSLSEHAFRLFLDYDGANTRVLGDSVPASSSDAALLGAYAVDQVGGPLRVLLFNRSPSTRDVDIALSGLSAQAFSAWRLAAGGYAQVANNQSAAGATLALTLPGHSATLLVFARGAPGPAIFANGFE